MTEESFTQRLTKLRIALEFSSNRQFAFALGYPNAENINRLGRKAGAKPPVTLINDIMRVFPNVNPEWLLGGEGEMMTKNDSFAVTGDRIGHLISHYNITIREFAGKVGRNEWSIITMINEGTKAKPDIELMANILEAFPEVNPSWMLLNKGEMIRTDFSDNRIRKMELTCDKIDRLELTIVLRKTDD